MEADYKVKLEVFEGPLDLLLYLIKKEEVDIYDIPIERITNQYMEYLTLMKLLNLEVAGEFLVMAATLMYIKSRMLLPVDQQITDSEAEEGEDPRWELIRQLVEYKKFKDAALQLGKREEEQSNIFVRAGDTGVEIDAKSIPLAEVSIFDLINIASHFGKHIELFLEFAAEVGGLLETQFPGHVLYRLARKQQVLSGQDSHFVQPGLG